MAEHPISRKRALVRTEVEQALGERRMGSVKTAFKFAGGLAAFAAIIAGWLQYLKLLNGPIAIGLVALTVVAFFIALIILEADRMGRHSFLLRELLHADDEPERVYETLLIEARRERDEARALATASETRAALVIGVRELIGANDDKPQRVTRKRLQAKQQGNDDE